MTVNRFSHPFIKILFLTYFGACSSAREEDKWTTQLQELKAMMIGMDIKLSNLEKKISEVSFLDHAFQVNSVDSQLTVIKHSVNNIESIVKQVEQHQDSLLEILRDPHGPGSFRGEIEKRDTQQARGSLSVDNEDSLCKDLTKKVEDYSYKIAKSQQELKDAEERHRQALGNVLDTVKSGFTKTFQRVDVLPNTERQLSRISTIVSGLSALVPQALTKLTNISDHLTNIHTEILSVTRSKSGDSSNSDEKFAAPLVHALELGNRVKTDLQKLVQFEPDISRSARMAKNLLEGLDSRRPTSMETLKNLTMTLEAIEDNAVPLLFSAPYNFDGIYELLDTTLASVDRHTINVCNFQEVFKLEMKNISDSIGKQKSSSYCSLANVQGSAVKSNDENETGAPVAVMKHKDVFDNLAFVRSAITLIQTDLKELFRKCPDNSIPTAKPLGLILG